MRTKFKAALLLFSVSVLLAGGAPAMDGQSALDAFDPNANGAVLAVVVQPDGKILLGGDFTTLAPNGGAPVTRNRIARLNPDGSLDTAFNPNANGTVNAIALQPDGKISVGGDFISIGGQPRNRIARLNATDGLADSFNPNASGTVYTIAVQADGKILVGGAFSGANSISGQLRNRIARLDPGGAADSFDPNANSDVRVIVVQANGKILVGGAFTGANSIGGQARLRIARLDANTGLADSSFNPSANGLVRTIALQADGKILAGGAFNGANSIGGQQRNRIARLDPTTGAADSFDPDANIGNVYSIVVQPDGRILASGTFTMIGGQPRNRMARLSVTGTADSFDPSVSSTGVFSMALQQDGKILAGGAFSVLTPNGGAAFTRNNIARLEADGRLDRALDLNLVGNLVLATAVQPDGKILIGGTFTSVLGTARNNIARLNTDGTLDVDFDPNASGRVNAIAVQADGKLLAGGTFSSIGGQARHNIGRLDPTAGLADSFNPDPNNSVNCIALQADGKILVGGTFTSGIARLDATGAADPSFAPNANNNVLTVALQPDGKILVGGDFNNIGGQSRHFIARLDTSGAADSFNPNASGTVQPIAVQADGRILVGGQFSVIGAQSRNSLARLDATGAADSFDPDPNSPSIDSIAVQADGKILTGGLFTGIGGQTRHHIARLDPATGAADSFDPNADSTVESIAVQADGRILAGGDFTSIGGQARNLFARVNNDTIAVQNLAVSQTTVTWIRGGSSPQLTRVTFEDSTDGVTYNFLGNGTASGSNWTLTGLNLSIGQNIYIRARGYHRSGFNNGSESITESVRNVFIAPPQPTSVVSLKTHGSSGAFPINLPLGGSPGIECRKGQGANSDQHQVVFTFAVPITLSGSPTVSVSAPAGGTPGTTASVSGSVVTVNLTGILNAQTLTITLTDVNDSGPISVPMGVLFGDVNADGFVLSGDYTAVRQRSGSTVDTNTFFYDTNVDGFILSGDYTGVRQQSGSHL